MIDDIVNALIIVKSYRINPTTLVMSPQAYFILMTLCDDREMNTNDGTLFFNLPIVVADISGWQIVGPPEITASVPDRAIVKGDISDDSSWWNKLRYKLRWLRIRIFGFTERDRERWAAPVKTVYDYAGMARELLKVEATKNTK